MFLVLELNPLQCKKKKRTYLALIQELTVLQKRTFTHREGDTADKEEDEDEVWLEKVLQGTE